MKKKKGNKAHISFYFQVHFIYTLFFFFLHFEIIRKRGWGGKRSFVICNGGVKVRCSLWRIGKPYFLHFIPFLLKFTFFFLKERKNKKIPFHPLLRLLMRIKSKKKKGNKTRADKVYYNENGYSFSHLALPFADGLSYIPPH